MSTPCAIGMKMPDGSVNAVRCNYDGYVAGAGAILGGWYKDAAKVADLLALGELSQLSEELASCIAYHRDCHEPMRPAVRFANIESYRRCAKGGMSADYLYLYDDGEWLVYGLYHEPNWVKMEIKKMKKISLEEMMDALSRCESCALDLSEATEQEIKKEYMLLRKIGLLKTSGEPPANLRRTSGEPPANLRREDVEHLKPEELVEMLKTNGSMTISIGALKRHIASGATVNSDGTIDLINYAAWLAKFVE